MIALFALLLTTAAVADEGLSPNAPGGLLQPAWDASFLIYHHTADDASVGSAFVVRKTGTAVDLMTADHVIAAACGPQNCANLSVYENVSATRAQMLKGIDGAVATMATVIARDPGLDLAIIRVNLVSAAEPLRVATECSDSEEVLAAIGFPLTYLRPSPVDIDSPQTITKRWSRGKSITRASLKDNGEFIRLPNLPNSRSMIMTSVDGLVGNSGGPVINEFGAVAGVVVRTGLREGDHHYNGRGLRPSLQVNAIMVPCELVTEFLGRAAKP